MTRIKIAYFLFAFLAVISHRGISQVNNPVKISSPDKSTSFETGADKNGRLMYRMLYAGQEVTTWSRLGFMMNDVTAGENTTIKSKTQKSHREKFAWPLGEDDTITSQYNECRLSCASSSLQYHFTVRVFDGSVAFMYEVPEQPGFKEGNITQENTAFTFTQAYTLYQYNQESVFTPVAIDTFNRTCDLPATLTSEKLFISIGEADNQNYTKAELKKGDLPNSLVIALVRDRSVKTEGAFHTPWRTISVSHTAIGLHKFSQLFLKLASTPRTVPEWIKPGKLIRAQLNTQSGLDCISFAAKHNLQYIMFDAGWYGKETSTIADPAQVIPQLDMPQVIAYGKEKGIGVILYVNYVGLKAKLDTIIPLYKKWGVSGMKFGFVDGLTQSGLTWLNAAMKKVYDAGFILDIHDNYKPTGLSRTYPALLTQEGIRGDENSPDAFHTTVLPFTRFLAGPADFTFCYPNAKNSYSKNLKVSMAQQLALTVIYFSPLQSVFWYGNPNEYTNEEEIEFFGLVPTVWNESRYLQGDIGKNISVARRKGDTWYVGNAAGLADWKGSLKLDFLANKKRYTATVYEDDQRGSIRKRTVPVSSRDSFAFDIKASGGQAIVIEPVN